MRVRVVPELADERVSFEGRLDNRALDAATAAMDQTHFAKPCIVSGADVFLDDGRNVARAERVQVQLGLDRNAVRRIGH
jgi:hypothetical protein